MEKKKRSQEHIDKIIASRKLNDKLLNRKKKSWNKGLTKETDERIKSCKNKGKSFEEIYGDKSEEVKKKISETTSQTMKERGHKPPVEAYEKIKEIRKGKTLEEIYGIEKAKEIKSKLSESHKGNISGNKGKKWQKNKLRIREIIQRR